MGHKSGHIIISVALPHEGEESEETQRLRKEPAVKVDLDEPCTEDDCAEMARLAFRRLKERGD